MIYELPLTIPHHRFIDDDESYKRVEDKLRSITNFKERLSFYNINVRSLATYEKHGAQIYYECDNQDLRLKVFCNCNNCQSKPDFDVKAVIIYQALRAKEIERLLTAINTKSSYKERIAFLFGTKGFIPDHTPAIWDNRKEKPLVDLRPKIKEECRVYNQFVIDFFKKQVFYTGFDFEEQQQRLNERLLNPVTDKGQLLQYIQTIIEKHFNYRQSPHSESKNEEISSHIPQFMVDQVNQLGNIPNLFTRLCFGEIIDPLKFKGLDSYSLLKYTHVIEIHKFYEYVKKVIINPNKPTISTFENVPINPEYKEAQTARQAQETQKAQVDFTQGTDRINLDKPEMAFDWSKAKNSFNQQIPIEKVYNHFKGWLVDKGYLSITDFEKYIIMAFVDIHKPVEKLAFAAPYMADIYDAFYHHWATIAGRPNGKATKYASLLCDYFGDYNISTVSTNWKTGRDVTKVQLK